MNCRANFEALVVFLQTGSGKTYTMMGEINEVEGKLNDDCGITPRIFEYLFSRIRMVRCINFQCFLSLDHSHLIVM